MKTIIVLVVATIALNSSFADERVRNTEKFKINSDTISRVPRKHLEQKFLRLLDWSKKEHELNVRLVKAHTAATNNIASLEKMVSSLRQFHDNDTRLIGIFTNQLARGEAIIVNQRALINSQKIAIDELNRLLKSQGVNSKSSISTTISN